MSSVVDSAVRALTDSFGSVERPGFKDHERSRLWSRAHDAVAVVPGLVHSVKDVSHQLNIIAHTMGQFGTKDSEIVRSNAYLLGSVLGVKFVTLAA